MEQIQEKKRQSAAQNLSKMKRTPQEEQQDGGKHRKDMHASKQHNRQKQERAKAKEDGEKSTQKMTPRKENRQKAGKSAIGRLLLLLHRKCHWGKRWGVSHAARDLGEFA